MFESDKLKELTQLEYNIYDFIISNHTKVPYMTIRELADACGISTTTVLKFCEKLGYSRYKEFKEDIAIYFKKNDFNDLKGFHEELTGFFKVANLSDLFQNLKECIEIIKNKEAVLFVGSGSSGILAEYGARCFSNIGKTSHFINGADFPANVSFYRNWVVIFLSVSGETLETITLAEKFCDQDIDSISITSYPNATLVKLTKQSLIYNLKQIKIDDDFNITSQIPVLFIIESLSKSLLKLIN